MSEFEVLLGHLEELQIPSLRKFGLEIKFGPTFQMFPEASAMGTQGSFHVGLSGGNSCPSIEVLSLGFTLFRVGKF